MSDDSAERTRRFVEEKLRRANELEVSAADFFRNARLEANNKKLPFDWNVAVEYWWELARTGVIALVGGESQYSNLRMFVVTKYGLSVLAGDETSPHNRGGYVAALRRNHDADAVALGYVDEAVGAWQSGLYRASAVMLGCACERLVLLLAEAIAGANVSPYSDQLREKLYPPSRKGTTPPPSPISGIFSKVREAVEVVGGDEFDRSVTAIFDHARILRNASGHPTGAEVTRDDAQAGLLMFPGFHTRTLEIIARVRAYGGSGAVSGGGPPGTS